MLNEWSVGTKQVRRVVRCESEFCIRAAAYNRLLERIHGSCFEVGHGGNPHCRRNSLECSRQLVPRRCECRFRHLGVQVLLDAAKSRERAARQIRRGGSLRRYEYQWKLVANGV